MKANEQRTHLDLFSGIGGFSLAFEAEGFKTVAFCENSAIKRIILRHHWPDTPIVADVNDAAGLCAICAPYGTIDVLTAGVPCQPASPLGQQRGTSDERWMWPATIRALGAIRPRYAVFENPPAILTLESGTAFNGIVSAMVALGYDLQWDVFPAAAFGAGHLRERLLIVATDAKHTAAQEESERKFEEVGRKQFGGEFLRRTLASDRDNSEERLPGLERGESRIRGRPLYGGGYQCLPDLRGRVQGENWWHETNTGIPVMVHGIPSKLVEASTKCAGDSVVPQVVQVIARGIRTCGY